MAVMRRKKSDERGGRSEVLKGSKLAVRATDVEEGMREKGDGDYRGGMKRLVYSGTVRSTTDGVCLASTDRWRQDGRMRAGLET